MRESQSITEGRLRLVQFTRSFHLGGTEGQVVELLRGLGSRHDVKVSVISEEGPLIEAVWELGHLPRTFPLNGSVVSPNTGVQVLRMARWLRENRIELVHAHCFYSIMIAVPAAKLAGCKVVVGRLDMAHWYGKARRAVLAQFTRMADHVIANADAVRQMLIAEEGVSPDKVSVLRNGLQLDRFDMLASAPLQQPLPDTHGEPVAVLVANMNPVKRQEDFLVALARAHQDGHRLHGFLVGDGGRRAELEKLAAELGISGRAHFLGHRKDVPAILKRAAIGVLCSSAEGLSNAIIEGMASRLPMIVTGVGGNPELVADGKRGWVVNPYRPTELHAALVKLLENPLQAQQMGAAGRAFVEQTLTLQRMVAEHEALYRRVCAEGADLGPSTLAA